MLSRAVLSLRADENIAELEPLLAFFATFVLRSEVVRRIMRWDMAVLRESPWYREILEEGIEQGVEQGVEQERQATVLRVLQYRFGGSDPELAELIRQLNGEQLQSAVDLAFEAASLDEVADWVSKEVRKPANGNGKR